MASQAYRPAFNATNYFALPLGHAWLTLLPIQHHYVRLSLALQSPGVSITVRSERGNTLLELCHRDATPVDSSQPPRRETQATTGFTFAFSDALRVKAGNRNTRPVYIVVSIG